MPAACVYHACRTMDFPEPPRPSAAVAASSSSSPPRHRPAQPLPRGPAQLRYLFAARREPPAPRAAAAPEHLPRDAAAASSSSSPPRRLPAQPLPSGASELRILVDGTAAAGKWGCGALAVGPSLVRMPDDQLGQYDFYDGGMQRQLLSELGDEAYDRPDADAISEALALMAGCELSLEACLALGLGSTIPIIVDRPAGISAMASPGRRRYSPQFQGTLALAAGSLWKLAHHMGPVEVITKTTLDVPGGREWAPHGLAAKGRMRCLSAVTAPPPHTANIWERALSIDVVRDRNGMVLRARITARATPEEMQLSLRPQLPTWRQAPW